MPRPPHWELGDPPPWKDADPTAITLARIVDAVRSAPAPEPLRIVPQALAQGPPAGVLVPIFEEDGEPTILFTRRAQDMRRHRGEVAFPGGRHDETDESFVATALREAEEEVALDPATVEILGELNPISTFASQTLIHAFVGVLPGRPPNLVANPAEVELIFTVPVRELLDLEAYREEIWNEPGRRDHRLPFFEIVGDTIWGATGHFLFQLLALITAEE